MYKAKRLLALLLTLLLCLGNVSVCMAETKTEELLTDESGSQSDGDIAVDESDEQSDGNTDADESSTTAENEVEIEETSSNDSDIIIEDSEEGEQELVGSGGISMPTGELLFITLAKNTDYRWNANGSAEKSNVIHLDDYSGSNCYFKLYDVTDKNGNKIDDGYYGIKHIKDNGTDRFVDIDDKSKKSGAKLHLWEDRDSELKGNNHRQFAFYSAGTDQYGNELYYIQNRNSELWMGYEDTDKNGSPSYEDKIIQTEQGSREKWIITKAVVPKQGGEVEDLIKDKEDGSGKEDGTFISLFKPGTLECVTAVDDIPALYTHLHFYRMGTNSKILLKWNSYYSAYEMAYCTDGENNIYDKVWDVENEGASEGTPNIHLWDRQSKNGNYNTSQLWRFFRQNDGSYTIQNAKTGKFIGYKYEVKKKKEENEEDPKSSGTLVQWDGKAYVLDEDEDKTTYVELAHFTIDAFAGTDNPVNFNYADDWMKDIPDDALLSSVNIPGTHDTGTAGVFWDASAQASISTCQKYYYGEQLNVGARSFDVRCNADKDDTSPAGVRIVHGSMFAPCYDRDGSKLYLQSILDDSVRFLKKHPSESIILLIKADGGSELGLAKSVGKFIKDHMDCVWTGDGIPTMGEARGKIVFMRRYSLKGYDYNADGLSEQCFGIDLSDWDSHNYSSSKYYAERIYHVGDTSVYVQDAYQERWDEKEKFIEGTLKQMSEKDNSYPILNSEWVFNYTSCVSDSGLDVPLDQTRHVNPWLYNGDGSKYFNNQRTGMVMLNFIDIQMSKLIYETNFNGGNFFAAKVTAPTTVKMTYGQSLGEASFSGQTGNGTWSFNDGSHIPTLDEYKAGKTFKMTFTPKDSRFSKITAEVKISDFYQKTEKVIPKVLIPQVKKSTSTAQKIAWNKVSGADGYRIYGAACGKSAKLLKTINGESTLSWTKSSLKANTYYKYYVDAYKLVGGKKVRIAKSACIHATTTSSKYGNPTGITVKQTAISLKKGKMQTLKATVQVPAKRSVKVHSAKIRYATSNPYVATVSKSGQINAKGTGSCKIYVYTQNGIRKTVTVTVK